MACSVRVPARTAVTRDDSRCCNASPSECAGSVDTASTRRPPAASASAHAAAQVVFPTPPLPPKKMNRGVPPSVFRLQPSVFRLPALDLHPRHVVLGGHRDGSLAVAFQLAQA